MEKEWKKENLSKIIQFCKQSSCGSSSRFTGTTKIIRSGFQLTSAHRWIGGYVASAEEHGVDIVKSCSDCSYIVTVALSMDAWDMSDFNDGQTFKAPGLNFLGSFQDSTMNKIRDKTPLGYDYKIESYTSSILTFKLKEPL